MTTIDLAAAYGVDPQVAIRPEPFGALCYHYGNRRLTFLKSHDMVDVVAGLGCRTVAGGRPRGGGRRRAALAGVRRRPVDARRVGGDP